MIRWLGFLLVVCGGAAVGFQLSDGIKQELRFYRDLQTALERMRWEISARLAPIPEAASCAAQGLSAPVSELFLRFSQAVSEQPAEPIPLRMLHALSQQRYSVPAEAKRILLTLCSMLGKPDVSAQICALDRALARLAEREQELQASKKARTRSYQTLGVCAGLAVAILLI